MIYVFLDSRSSLAGLAEHDRTSSVIILNINVANLDPARDICDRNQGSLTPTSVLPVDITQCISSINRAFCSGGIVMSIQDMTCACMIYK
jgi:hypothetical protein